MGDTLKAGTLGPESWDGSFPTFTDKMPPQFRNSMAAAIEAALNDALDDDGKPTFETEDNSAETRDRRVLFVAIAQGVINYLNSNEAAFKVNLQFSGPNVIGATISIDIE